MSEAADPTLKRKIAILGSRSVGKSSLVIQFVDNQFQAQYFPTIESTFTKSIRHNGVDYECDLVDTAGQDEFSILSSRHSVGVHGYILVYSVANRPSFDLVRTVHDKIVAHSGNTNIPCVVVGQKSDLSEVSHRQVPEAEGRQLAQKLGSAWVETSARQNRNIDKVFDLALGEIERGRSPPTAEPSTSKCVIM